MLNIDIRVGPLRGPRLVQDYLRWSEGVRSFFYGAPFHRSSYRRKWAELQPRFGRAEREAAAAALRPTSPRAAERLARFVEEGGAVVTTGQQTGILTGPLYTVYKTLSTIRLAGALEAELGVVVLPVFWSASEDHDWAEVNHAYAAVPGDGVHRLEVASPDARPLPMSDRLLGNGVRQVLDEAYQLLRAERFAEHHLKLVRGAYRPEETVAAAFRRLMESWFAPFDLLTTDAADPALKRTSRPVLEHALRAAGREEAALAARSRALREAGYHDQVAVLPGATNVFYHGADGRERLYVRDGTYYTRDSALSVPADRLLDELREEPGRFSPNVLLRPVVESSVFPVLAYVAGPGEISYFAQLGVLFEERGISPPVAYPRFSVTLVEESVRELMERLELEIGELDAPRHELVGKLARRVVPPQVSAALERLGEALVEGYRELIDGSTAVDPTLAGPLGALRNASLANLGRSERKILQHLKRRDQDVLADLDRLLAHLHPEGQPQERVLNVLPFLARHGDGLLPAILAELVPTWTPEAEAGGA